MRGFVAVLLAGALSLWAGAAWARPVSVTLYPDSARVQERTEADVSGAGARREAVFFLPDAADPASLSLTVSGGDLALTDVSVTRQARRDEARIVELQSRLAALEAKRQDLADTKTAHEGAAAFWRSRASAGTEKGGAAEARAMASALREGLYTETAKASALEREMAVLAKDMAELRQELDGLTGGSETVWLARASLEGTGAKAILEYAYTVDRCGWTPAYTLDARPAEDAVRFAFEAEVRQATGLDWSDVSLTLATAFFHGPVPPPDLRPWIIAQRRPAVLQREVLKGMDMAVMEARAPAMAGSADEPPALERLVFDEYDLGRMTLASGQAKRLTLRRAKWKAAFDWLVRPQLTPRAFLRARAALGEPQRIPPGPAALLLDGALVRKDSFELYAQEAELFFGADPEIAVQVDLVRKLSGAAGFVSARRTQDWDWRVGLKNAKARAVRVRVEDSLPQARHEKIEIERRFKNAIVQDEAVVWELEIPARGSAVVEYGYTVSWPKDMDVDLGGR